MKDMTIHIKDVFRTPTDKTKKAIPCHIIVKTPNIQKNEGAMKDARQNAQVTKTHRCLYPEKLS